MVLLILNSANILSIKWTEDNSMFYTGSSNGSITQWNYPNAQILKTLSTSSAKTSKTNIVDPCMIWTLCPVGNKYIASGNSKGTLSVWDSQFGVLLKEFHEHEADILTTCTNKLTNTVYFTGSSSIICSIQLINEEWKITSKFRGQSHDIHSIALLKYSKI
jgi:WD40 repeat protein